MRKNLSTLIILLCLAAVSFSAVCAKKTNRNFIARPTNMVLSADSVSAESILNFAQNLIGIHYRSACSDPLRGFDCSGFVSYVFKSFNFVVPRSSYEFIGIGQKVKFEDAKPGDIILFTGTKKHTRRIGHVGIVFSNVGDDFKFIHSTSGKEHGVTITNMDKTYRRRFVQIIRVLKQNDNLLVVQASL